MTDWVTYEKAFRMPLGIWTPVVRIAECYFASASAGRDEVDVSACLFHSTPLLSWRGYEGATRILDLKADSNRIFGGFSRGNRRNIKIAQARDGTMTAIVCEPRKSDLDDFCEEYDRFAITKGIPRLRRAQLDAWRAAGKLILSSARGPDGTVLVSHAYLHDDGRARLTHSASHFRLEQASADRGRIGRANRLLHWSDIGVLKERGADIYDFGGWYLGSRDDSLLAINAFKREFGGEIVKEWSSFQSGSTLGRLYLSARHIALRRHE